MRLISAFLRLIRLPNLFFIALTQCLFQYGIYYPLYRHAIPPHDNLNFMYLVLASVFIAAAGYVINDYFDINIDEVNKPHRMVVDKFISRRWAIFWHFILSLGGVIFTALAVPVLEKWYLVLANMFCVAVLWFYSTNFKKSLLIGNIVISLLTAWTILIIFFSKVSVTDAFDPANNSQPKFFRFAILYAGFAFMTSLIREAVKDIEDMHGDARYGCRTMPIVWGINAAKVYTAVWMTVLIIMLLIIEVYILQFQWWWIVAYSALFLVTPLLFIFRGLFKASSTENYHQLSGRIKGVMLAGIVSMAFFYFYL
jgi:4-hydroxybenzoate polyprenyltransferase